MSLSGSVEFAEWKMVGAGERLCRVSPGRAEQLRTASRGGAHRLGWHRCRASRSTWFSNGCET